jgi:hypothetical protein
MERCDLFRTRWDGVARPVIIIDGRWRMVRKMEMRRPRLKFAAKPSTVTGARMALGECKRSFSKTGWTSCKTLCSDDIS